MILYTFTILDRVAGFYGTPFHMASPGEARRAFADLAADPSSNVARHPADYDLYQVGHFDTESGEVFGHKPEFLLSAVASLQRQPSISSETSLEAK